MHRPLRVLLVEDHLSTRTALRSWLSNLGHEVEAAGTVADALTVAEKYPFELLISDLGLPDGDGRYLVGKLRQQREFHAVAITGNTGQNEEHLSHIAGFEQYLEKPVDIDALREILGNAAKEIAEE